MFRKQRTTKITIYTQKKTITKTSTKGISQS